MLSISTKRKRLLSARFVTDVGVQLITNAEAKVYLNTSVSDEDDLITSMVDAAVLAFESKTHRTLTTRNVETVYESTVFPLRLFKPPIQSVESITTEYQGTDTVDSVALGNAYLFNKDGLRPEIRFNTSGELAATNIETIRIVTKNGYGDAASDVPAEILQAIRMILSQFWDHRDDFEMGTIMQLPWDAQRIINDYEVPVL